MAVVAIEGCKILTFEISPREVYWTKLSGYIKQKHGEGPFTEHVKVEAILLDCFDFLVNEFRILISSETNLGFFMTAFLLHEESIKLYLKQLKGYQFPDRQMENNFSIYRRVLKLILEQGCDIDMKWGEAPNKEETDRIYDKIHDLYYLGAHMYEFADHVAFQKMVEECHKVYFTEEGWIHPIWQYHYGAVYESLYPRLDSSYVQATFDQNAGKELVDKISQCYGIDYNFAGGIIYHIKEQLNPRASETQTIEPGILPQNLVAKYGIDIGSAKQFYDGLTISRHNKPTIEEAIYKPYAMNRYMFRPILVYQIEGEERALVGREKYPESVLVTATNAIHWNAMQDEWKQNTCMSAFMKQKGEEHDAILEDKIEEIIQEEGYLYCRNIESLQRLKGNNVNFIKDCGEIDFIIINLDSQTIFVADSKYNRARYEAVGFRSDNKNFTEQYEPKIKKKTEWISKHLNILQEHLMKANNLKNLDILNFKVEGVFLINTPTFYMFNGNYKAITLADTGAFLAGECVFPTIQIENEDKSITSIDHPYFRKPILE